MRSVETGACFQGRERLQVLRLDVCDRQSITNAAAEAVDHFGSIDCLINSAGYGAFGLLEEASNEEVYAQMNTNFFGVVHTIQAVLPYMRRQRSGSIINITSVGGVIGMPMLSLYSASKFAVEGLTESLSHELADFGIRVHLIEPGAFKTGFSTAYSFNQGNPKDELNEYRERYKAFLDDMLAEPPKPFGYGDPQVVADLLLSTAENPRAPLRKIVGKDAKSLMLTQKFLGKKHILKIVKNSVSPKT